MTFAPVPPRRPQAPRRTLLGLALAGPVLTALALAGCGAAPHAPGIAGPAASRTALLQIKGNQMDLVLTRLDGREVDRAAGTRIELPPGDHVIAANLATASSEPIILLFSAEAGRRYTLDGSIVDGNSFVFRWTAEVTDETLRRVVSHRPDNATAPLWAKR